MKFEVWLDSGANIHSMYRQEITLEEYGLTKAEWDHATNMEKEELMRDIAFARSDWGWKEIK